MITLGDSSSESESEEIPPHSPVNLGSFEGRLERPKSHKSMKTKRRPWSFQLTCPTCKKLPKKLRIEGRLQ